MKNPLITQAGISNDFILKFRQFKNMFSGNPQQMVQQMLNSGQISQSQYAEAVEMAKQFMTMMK